MWLGIWFVAATWIGIWTWIWSMGNWTGARSDFLISMLGKLSWFYLTVLMTLVLLMGEMDGSVLEEKWSFKVLVLTFSSKWDWGSYMISIAKTASKKIGTLGCMTKFLSPEVALYLYKSTIHSCKENCCHVWAGAPSCYLELLVFHLLLLLNPWLIVDLWPA